MQNPFCRARRRPLGAGAAKHKKLLVVLASAALLALLPAQVSAQPQEQAPTCKNAAVSARISTLYGRIARYENRVGAMERERAMLVKYVRDSYRYNDKGEMLLSEEERRYWQLGDAISAHNERLTDMRGELAKLDALPPCNPPPTSSLEVASATPSLPAPTSTVLTSTAPSSATTAGYFVQVNVGGSWSVPTIPEGEHGKGSSAAFSAAIGERWGFHDRWAAGLIRFETYPAQESFSGALDDLKVRPTAVISAIGQIGPNFPGFAPGQIIAPYLETGPSAAYIKVSDAAGSNTKWTGGWTIGAGVDYRFNSWLLFDVNAHWTYLGTKTYQTGPFDVRLNEQVASVTGGFIFQFDPTTPSDIRLKHDIAQVGRLDNGLGLYRYRYLWSDQIYVGVMAQEVAEVIPDAVVRGPDGYLRVNYARLGLTLETWDEWVTSNKASMPLARADDAIE